MSDADHLLQSMSPPELPVALYTAAQCRALDRCVIDECGIPGIHLMKKAGRAAYQELLTLLHNLDAARQSSATVTVFCGAGNNAGDGYIVAALALQNNINATVVQVGDVAKLRGDAALALRFAEDAGVQMQPFSEKTEIADGVVVDALLGTGLLGEVRPEYRAAIDAINRSQLLVLAVDIPSGLCADTGAVLGAAVQAAATVTFIGVKRGLLTGRGPALVGRLVFADLDVPAKVHDAVSSQCRCLRLSSCLAALPPRRQDAHKGDFGHVLIIGGGHGMGGAAAMAAEAAARIGAGLVSAATRAENVPIIVTRRPEVMACAVAGADLLQNLIERATVLVVGPGLGRDDWAKMLLQAALAADLPLVVDADALNLLSSDFRSTRRENWILTPHPGEASRLLACDRDQIQRDRFGAVAALQAQYGGATVLKGAGTLITGGGDASARAEPSISLAAMGNPGMASGGMGDVLSGVIGALLAQGLDIRLAAELGVCLHATAADQLAAEQGQRGLLATDLMPRLQRLVNARRLD